MAVRACGSLALMGPMGGHAAGSEEGKEVHRDAVSGYGFSAVWGFFGVRGWCVQRLKNIERLNDGQTVSVLGLGFALWVLSSQAPQDCLGLRFGWLHSNLESNRLTLPPGAQARPHGLLPDSPPACTKMKTPQRQQTRT